MRIIFSRNQLINQA